MPTFLYAFYSLASVRKFKITKKCETLKWKTQHMHILYVFLMAAYSCTHCSRAQLAQVQWYHLCHSIRSCGSLSWNVLSNISHIESNIDHLGEIQLWDEGIEARLQVLIEVNFMATLGSFIWVKAGPGPWLSVNTFEKKNKWIWWDL